MQSSNVENVHIAMTFSFGQGEKLFSKQGAKLTVTHVPLKQLEVQVYPSTPAIQDRSLSLPMPVALEQHVQSINKRLMGLLDTPAPGTYLNFNTYQKKDLRPRTVLNKQIVDRNLRFNPSPENVQVVYYTIVGDSAASILVGDQLLIYTLKNLFKSIPEDSRDCKFHVFESVYEMAEAFFETLNGLSENIVTVALGFDSCLGRDCALETFIRVHEQDAAFQYKNGVESQMCKFTHLLMQSSTLPNVFFHDLQYLGYHSLTPQESKQLCGFDLKAYLQLTGEPCDVPSSEELRSTIKGGSAKELFVLLNQTLKGMQILNEKRNMVLQRIGTASYMELPLNYVLYETLPSSIQLWMMRIFRSKRDAAPFGMLIQYHSEDNSDQAGYEGAFIQHVPHDLLFKPLMFVAEGDFFSLYPTVMVAHNISPDTIIPVQEQEEEKSAFAVNLNQELAGKQAEVVYFSQSRKSIISEILEPLFNERRTEKDPIRKQAIKSIMVSVYGIMGSVYSPFYSIACARAITALGRQACRVALDALQTGGIIKSVDRVICANTDSVSFTMLSQHVESLIEQWPALNAAIQSKMGSPLYQFELELKKFSLCSVYTNKIKHCIRLVCDLKLFLQEGVAAAKKAKSKDLAAFIKGRLTGREKAKRQELRQSLAAKVDFVSSFSFSSIGAQRREDIRNLADDILIQILADNEFNSTRVNEMITEQESSVEKALKSRDLFALLKHAEFVKSSNNPVFLNLKANYGVKRGCLILPICRRDGNRKQSAANWIDLESYLKNQFALINSIDCGKLVYTYYQPIKRFFELIGNQPEDQILDSTEKLNLQAIKEQQPECCVRVETVVKVGKITDYTFLPTDFESLENMIMSAPKDSKQAFHEVFLIEKKRMFFDVDFEGAPASFTHEQVAKAIDVSLRNSIMANFKIHIAGAVASEEHKVSSMSKASFHVVLDILCDNPTNRYVAQVAELNLRAILKRSFPELVVDGQIFDLAVYGENKSLRLPFCGKIKKHVFENRQLVPLTQSTLKDFFITNLSGAVYDMPKNILLDPRLAVDLPDCSIAISKVDEDIFRDFLNKECNDVTWTFRNSRGQIITASPSKSYKCPVCSRRHDSRGLYSYRKSNSLVINCFSNKEKKITEVLREVALPAALKKADHEKIQLYYDRMTMPVYKEATRICDQRNINYDLDADLVFIISDMGTAKSKQLKEILTRTINLPKAKKQTNLYETVICLGFRKTFVTEFAKKFNLVSYEEIHGQMDLSTNPRMIIQVDSLMRLNTSKFPQLLIIDEVESILSKLLSCSNSGAVCHSFLELLRNSDTVIAMDGLMESRTVQYLTALRDTTNFTVTLNTFKPRKDYEMLIYPYKQINAAFIAQQFEQACGSKEEPKRVYGMITSYKLGEYVRTHLKALGKKVAYFHGENGLIEDTIHGKMTQQQWKEVEFTDVNTHWKAYDVVIHTSSVTAGISFEEVHFDNQINVFNTGTCDSGSFFQGSHRVRNISSKRILTFIEMDYTQQICTPAGYSDLEIDVGSQTNAVHVVRQDGFSQFIAWLKAREGCHSQFRLQMLLKYIRQMDYQVTVLPIPAEAPKQKIDLDLTVVEKMKGFALAGAINELMVKPEDRHAYDHKLNLFYLFTPRQNQGLIDTFGEEQLSLLYKQRYFQKLRQLINFVLQLHLGTAEMKGMSYSEFKELLEKQLSPSLQFRFTDLDTVKFVKDTFRLIDEVHPLLKTLAQKHAVTSKAFKTAFGEALREQKPKDPNSWVNRVITQLASHAKDLGINRRFKTAFSYFERICRTFTLKLNDDGSLYIPADIFTAIQDAIVPVPISLALPSDSQSQPPDEEAEEELSLD